MEFELSPRRAGGANVERTSGGWRLGIQAGPSHSYRLAQIDDYARARRSDLLHAPPWTFSLRARVSKSDLPGTWGFGLWNDPFGLSLGFGGKPGRLPVLPQTAWFMYASPPNWLSFRDDNGALPANGFFAGTFRSQRIPSILFAPGLLAFPFLAVRPLSRSLRRLASRIIRQDQTRVSVDVTQWHAYSIQWLHDCCLFAVDGREILRTSCNPNPPLGLVIWIDNQFAAWTPQGRLSYGTLENPAAWLDIENLDVEQK